MTIDENMTAAKGLSLPLWVWDRIETDRGDVSRSRFILRILETYYKKIDEEKTKVKRK